MLPSYVNRSIHRNGIGSARSQPSQHVGDDGIILELAEVLCINCQDYVTVSFIEIHSRKCTVVRPEVARMETEGLLEGVKMRAYKLYNYLFRISSNGKITAGDKNNLLSMQRLLSRLISVADYTNLKENTEVLASLDSLVRHVRRSPHLVVYVERLRSLAREQKQVLDELAQEANKPKELTLEEQLEFFKSKSQILEDALKLTRINLRESLKKAVEVVSSETQSRASESLSLNSSLENLGTLETIEADSNLPRFDYLETDDEQKVFYSQCLTLKLHLAESYNVESVPIYSIYAKAKGQNVNKANWTSFITEEIISKAASLENSKGRGLRRRIQIISNN